MPYPRTLVAGPCRKGRGLPDCIFQKEESRKEAIEKAKGTVKVATHTNGVVGISIYDSKPFFYLTTMDEALRVVKTKEYNDPYTGEVKTTYRLNCIDNYNHGMHGVDVADQLRNEYRPDGLWWRNRKWWWSVWIWLFGVVCTNAFVIYKANCKKSGAVPMTHLDFLEGLCDEMSVGKCTSPITKKRKRNGESQPLFSSPGMASAASECVSGDHRTRHAQQEANERQEAQKNRKPKLNANRLNHMATTRLDGAFHPTKSVDPGRKNNARCQLCKFVNIDKIRIAKVECTKCNMWFCSNECYTYWHSASVVNKAGLAAVLKFY
jgi:Transposase IS4